MTHVAKFTFNPFQENTYVVYDDTKECVIFDPGCSTTEEKQLLSTFISSNNLKPVRLINTHCHVDHVLGNKYVAEKYGLGLEIHEGELPVLQSVPQICAMYGLPQSDPSPSPSRFLKEGTTLTFGETELDILFTPGHSPASISFFCEESNFVIAGDVLFRESIGRTDLPGGNFDILMDSIKTQFYPLGDNVRVYSGHGGETTIGYERKHNLFLNGSYSA